MIARPTALPVLPDYVPAAMRAEVARWCVWMYMRIGGTWKKLPYQVATPGEEAKTNVPDHFGSFDDALRLYQAGGFDGIGFLLGDDWSGVDVDDCVDEHGEINAFGRDILTQLNSYTERSPSGTGIKIFLRAWPVKNFTKKGLEVYGHGGRYFTVTGQHV
jgi:putative DNA primase/helicase